MQKQRDTFYSLWPKTSPKNEKTFFFAVLSTNFCKHMSSNTKQLWLSSQKTFFLKHFFFFCWLKKSLGKSIKPFFSAETKKHQQCVKKTKTSQSKRLLREKRSWPFFSKFKKYLPSKEFEQKNEKNKGLVKVWQKKYRKRFGSSLQKVNS